VFDGAQPYPIRDCNQIPAITNISSIPVTGVLRSNEGASNDFPGLASSFTGEMERQMTAEISLAN
jgi:hypothetical protein